MNALQQKTALVTGGSRGLGRGIVEALAAEGVQVWALARNENDLENLKHDFEGVQTIAADVTAPHIAEQVLREMQPDILVLNAGAVPFNKPIHEQTWEQFNLVWNTDVKYTFEFCKQALLQPLAPGSTVIIVSSGAAIGGSPLSGGYASSKRAQWFLAQYFQQESDKLGLGIRFVALVPRQMVNATGVGDMGISTYSAAQGITKEEFIAQMGAAPLTPKIAGQGVVALLTEYSYQEGLAFGVSGQGLASLN